MQFPAACMRVVKCPPPPPTSRRFWKVVPEEKTFGYKGPETRQAWKKANIVFFGDYVEAACHAYKRRLIQVNCIFFYALLSSHALETDAIKWVGTLCARVKGWVLCLGVP